MIESNGLIIESGKITLPSQKDMAAVYNGEEELVNAGFEKDDESVSTIELTVEGEGEGYTFEKFDTPTKKPFYVVALPFQDPKAGNMTVSIITKKGEMYTGTLDAASQKKFTTDATFQKIKEGGKIVELTVNIKDGVKEGTAYTSEQFMKAWEKAATTHLPTKVDVPSDIVVNEDLTLANGDKMTIEGSGKLTVKSLVVNGELDCANDLTVNGDLTLGSNAVLSGSGKLTVKGETVFEGHANWSDAKEVKLGNVRVYKAADVELSGYKKMGTVKNEGKLTLTPAAGSTTGVITNDNYLKLNAKVEASIESITNNAGAELSLGGSNLIIGTITNNAKGKVTLAANYTINGGSFTNKGIVDGGNYAITNNGTINVDNNAQNDAEMKVKITNAAASATQPAGVINVNTIWAPSKTLTNYGKIVVNSGSKDKPNTLTLPSDYTDNKTAEIDVTAENAVLNATNVSGEVDANVIFGLASAVQDGGTFNSKTFVVKDLTSAIPSGVQTVRYVKCNPTISDVNNNIELTAGVTATFSATSMNGKTLVVLGNATVKGSSSKLVFNFESNGNKVAEGAVLTIDTFDTISGTISVKDATSVVVKNVKNTDAFNQLLY